MAIIVEEEKKKTNILGIAGWVVFIGLVLAVIYYIFFASPTLVVIPASGAISTIAPIANANLNPQGIVSSTQFESLQSNITLPTPESPASVGRANPFITP
jgi:hypothetical protein